MHEWTFLFQIKFRAITTKNSAFQLAFLFSCFFFVPFSHNILTFVTWLLLFETRNNVPTNARRQIFMLNSCITQLDATMMMMVYALCFGTSFSFQSDVLFVIIVGICIQISAFLTFYRLNQIQCYVFLWYKYTFIFSQRKIVLLLFLFLSNFS